MCELFNILQLPFLILSFFGHDAFRHSFLTFPSSISICRSILVVSMHHICTLNFDTMLASNVDIFYVIFCIMSLIFWKLFEGMIMLFTKVNNSQFSFWTFQCQLMKVNRCFPDYIRAHLSLDSSPNWRNLKILHFFLQTFIETTCVGTVFVDELCM